MQISDQIITLQVLFDKPYEISKYQTSPDTLLISVSRGKTTGRVQSFDPDTKLSIDLPVQISDQSMEAVEMVAQSVTISALATTFV